MSYTESIESEVSLVKPRALSKQEEASVASDAEDDTTPFADFIDSFLLEDDDDDAAPPKKSSKLPTIPESNLEYEDSETKPNDRASPVRESKDESLLEKKDKDTVSEESITTTSSEESRDKIEIIPVVEEEPITDETVLEIKPKSVDSQKPKEVEEKPKPKAEEEDVGFVFMNDAEEIVFTILLKIIRDITKKAGGEEAVEEEVVVKRRKGPPRKVDEIKMSIDDLSDTYSVHGTEFRRPISYLWKTGMVKDFLIKEEKYLKNLPLHGENVVSLNPYILTRSYGYSPWIPIINLSKKNKVKVAFVVGNAIVVYNYKKNKIQYLQGHRNLIQSMNCDLHTRWIVSADGGYDNTVTVWDIKKRIPLKTYFTPHAKGTRVAGFDLSSKYIITVSFGQQVVDIWSWTEYSDEPVVSVRLNRDTPAVRKICFCYDNLQYFLLTTDTSIICGRFSVEPKLLSLYEGKLLTEVGLLRDSAYVTYTHFVYSVTDKGHAVMWSDKVFQKSFVYNEPRYKKVQIKTMKLLKVGINTIQVIETSKMLVVIGDDKGCVRFYDILFRILYWCEHISPGSVVSTEFSFRMRREQVWKYVVLRGRTTAPDFQNNETFEQISTRNNKNKEEAYKSQLQWRHLKEIPEDVTLQKQTFLAVNFFVSSTDGNIYYVYYAKDKSVVVVQGHTCPLSCVMTHPSSSLVYYGNSEGKLSVYDFYDESMIVEKDLRAEDVDIKDPNQFSYCVTSIGISPVGLEMAVGLENGTLFFLDSNLLEIQAKFQKSTEAIRKIVFDKNVNYMAHTDDAMCVSLYGLGFPRNYMGKYKSHYAPITDLIFTFRSSSLLSIGQDRQIVLYSIPKNFDGLLNIAERKPIEQFAMPLTLIPYNPKDVEAGKVKYHGNVHEISDDDYEDDSEEEDDHNEELILVANDEFKYRLITCSTLKVIKTIQAPSLPSPIKFLSYLPNSRSDKSGATDNNSDDSKDSRDKTDRTTFMLFGTNNEIGIQLLPLSGNPFKSLAIAATATNLIGMAVSCDGEYMFTIAENDRSLLMWKINERSVRMSAYYGGTGLDPYYGMLAGGYTGQLLKEMKEYFYYSQIVHEGEYITGARHITDKIHLCDVINYFNAIGFFPSLLEAQTIIEEVKLSKNQGDVTQDIEIQFDELVKLYVNHRPTKGVKDEDIRKAFRTIARAFGENPEFITRNDFLRVLQHHGEMLSQNEITNIMNILVNRNRVSDGLGNKSADVQSLLPLIITYKFFVEEILGCDSEKFNFESTDFSSQNIPSLSLSGSVLLDASTSDFPSA